MRRVSRIDAATNRLIRRIEATLADALLRIGVAPDDLILVAVSGGPDSMALLHATHRIGRRIAAAHLNHGLRSAESDRDEAFVRRVCAELGIELIVESAGLGTDTGNLEERARDVRRAFLDRAADQLGTRWIALGHQANDQAETIILRMLRGAGIAGLSAMTDAGPGRIIRPLLTINRDDLLRYLKAIGVEFVVDSSNDSARHLRNRVRNELIPMIERNYVPGFARRLIELGRELRDADEFIAMTAERELHTRLNGLGKLELSGFDQLHPALAAAMMRRFLAIRTGTLRRIDRVHIRGLMDLCCAGPSNGKLDLPGGWRAIRTYATLSIELRRPISHERYAVELVKSGLTVIEPAACRFEATLTSPDAAALPEDLHQAVFDADRLPGPLIARNILHGDRIAPLGMAGSRKVKDVFIDYKLPPGHRVSYPLIASGEHIVWIPGVVRSRQALLSDETQKVLRLEAFFLGSRRYP
jgi:tRNA(Ile)-lysidine synthase